MVLPRGPLDAARGVPLVRGPSCARLRLGRCATAFPKSGRGRCTAAFTDIGWGRGGPCGRHRLRPVSCGPQLLGSAPRRGRLRRGPCRRHRRRGPLGGLQRAQEGQAAPAVAGAFALIRCRFRRHAVRSTERESEEVVGRAVECRAEAEERRQLRFAQPAFEKRGIGAIELREFAQGFLAQSAREPRFEGPIGLLEFNFEKSKFMSIDVDHVVVHPRRSAVGHASGQMRVARTLRFDQAQRAARQRDDHVIQAMNMLARFCTGGEGPLGYDYSFIFDLYGRNSFHRRQSPSLRSPPSLAD
jgi:hypothetical protein